MVRRCFRRMNSCACRTRCPARRPLRASSRISNGDPRRRHAFCFESCCVPLVLMMNTMVLPPAPSRADEAFAACMGRAHRFVARRSRRPRGRLPRPIRARVPGVDAFLVPDRRAVPPLRAAAGLQGSTIQMICHLSRGTRWALASGLDALRRYVAEICQKGRRHQREAAGSPTLMAPETRSSAENSDRRGPATTMACGISYWQRRAPKRLCLFLVSIGDGRRTRCVQRSARVIRGRRRDLAGDLRVENNGGR